MKKILFTIEVDDKIKDELNAEFKDLALTFMHKHEVTKELIDAHDALVGNVDAALLKDANIEWFQAETSGVEQYLGINKDIILTNATGAYGQAIAEHMLACVMYFYKRLNAYQRQQDEAKWFNLGKVDSIMSSKTLVVGLGDIGNSFARVMHGLGSKVDGIKRRIGDVPAHINNLYPLDKLADIIGNYDIVAMALPNTPKTAGLMNYDLLNKMQDRSILINVGRGNAIKTDDLLKVLDEGKFKGVALDVTDPEPLPSDHPLWAHPNVLITPHVSGNYNMDYTYQLVIEIVKKNLKHYESGEALTNLVDRASGYRK